jgi:hypothetical protein
MGAPIGERVSQKLKNSVSKLVQQCENMAGIEKNLNGDNVGTNTPQPAGHFQSLPVLYETIFKQNVIYGRYININIYY